METLLGDPEGSCSPPLWKYASTCSSVQPSIRESRTRSSARFSNCIRLRSSSSMPVMRHCSLGRRHGITILRSASRRGQRRRRRRRSRVVVAGEAGRLDQTTQGRPLMDGSRRTFSAFPPTSLRVAQWRSTCHRYWPMADVVARGGIGSLGAPCGASGT
eukprot:2294506-Prymnesium_polylepis.1